MSTDHSQSACRLSSAPRLRIFKVLVWLIAAAASVAALPAAAGPTFNGGPVLSNPQDVYYIYYGNNWTSSEKTLTQQLIGDLSGSTYFNINSTYGSATTSLTFSGSASVTSSSGAAWLGSTLEARGSAGDTTMLGIVNKAIADGLANDANGIYYVLTSDDVLVKGFNSVSVDFCGWHSSTKSNTNTLGRQFGFIGEPSGISIGGSGCQDSLQTPGLGDFGVDAMDSVIAHELSETVTDPTGTAWWDSNSASSTYKNENADMCAWKFGSTYSVAGGNANVNLNGHDYLLQENWINTGNGTGSCALSYGRASIDVPEPESFFLLGISLACLGLGRRRKPVPA